MSNPTNIQSLFATAAQQNTLSPVTANILQSPDLGAVIQAGLGTSVDDVNSSEVTLVTILLDDSGSIAYGNNEQVIRDGVNMILDALGATKSKDGILITCAYLNNKAPLYPYVPLANAVRLDARNFNANGGTPLYDRTVETFGLVLAKSQEFADAGVSCRSVTVVVTDGADAGSRRRAQDVLPLTKDLLRQETHIICGMGINDGSTDFRKVFAEMGIEAKWTLTPGNSPSEIRKAFAFFSQSAVRASQAAPANFSQVQAGGFGSPPSP